MSHLTPKINLKRRMPRTRPACRGTRLAGPAGFEPTGDGVKVRCLTAWRRPNISKAAKGKYL